MDLSDVLITRGLGRGSRLRLQVRAQPRSKVSASPFGTFRRFACKSGPRYHLDYGYLAALRLGARSWFWGATSRDFHPVLSQNSAGLDVHRSVRFGSWPYCSLFDRDSTIPWLLLIDGRRPRSSFGTPWGAPGPPFSEEELASRRAEHEEPEWEGLLGPDVF